MDLGIKSKVALVCASSEGIGKAIAAGLAAEGAHVALFSRDIEKLNLAAQDVKRGAQGRVSVHQGDLAISGDIVRVFEDVVKEHGSIDILINNQGGPDAGSLLSVTDEQVDRAYSVNLKSVLLLTKLCLPQMRERKWGRIINVLSLSGKEPLPNMLLSNIFRPAVLGLAKTVAHENAAFNITVNSILPAAVMTNRTRKLLTAAAESQKIDFETILANSVKNIPIGRIASPEEFVQLALFLCSQNASYVTGSAISVDGGISKSLW